jgi:hypothetical protein
MMNRDPEFVDFWREREEEKWCGLTQEELNRVGISLIKDMRRKQFWNWARDEALIEPLFEPSNTD